MERYRFKFSMLLLIGTVLFLTSCGTDDAGDPVFETVRTVVKGNVSDVERNMVIPDFEVKLIRSWQCTSVVQASICTEDVSTVYTDELGNYEIEFDYIKDGKNYGFEKVYYGYPYYTEYIEDYGPIIPGEINTYNMDAWRTVKIKLNLQIRNNNSSPLLIDNKIVGLDNLFFPQESVFEQNRDITVYLDSKPNAEVELNFHYTTGYSNSDYHNRREIVQTTLQDTIEFSYMVDCSTF